MIESIWIFVSTNILPHFPFLVYALAFAFFGQISKRYVWNAENTKRWRMRREALKTKGGFSVGVKRFSLGFLLYFPLPLHPVVTAVALSFIPTLWMSPGMHDHQSWRATYLIGAALLSLSIYDIIHAILKKNGFNLKLPGEATFPPEATKQAKKIADTTAIPPTPKLLEVPEERGGP